MSERFPGNSNKLLHKVLAWLWRMQRAEFTYPWILNGSRKVLLILPREPDALKLMRRWRERILFAMGNRKTVILSIGAQLEYVEEWSPEHLFFTDGDVNAIGLASRRVVNAVQKEQFKIAVDLSPDFDFVTAQVPLRAKIPNRVGIVDSEHRTIGEKYFNILLCRSPQLDYENIARLVGMRKV